jgi:hypothetical protein
MHSLDGRRLRLVAPLALALVAGVGALSLRAGDALSTDFAVATDATAPSNPPLNVAEANKDANGNIKVHEQGIVQVMGTVDVGNSPKVQDVNVTNELKVEGGTTRLFFREIDDFDENMNFQVDISQYSKIRILAVVNGSGTVHFDFETDAGVYTLFDVDSGGFSHSELLGEVAGTKLFIYLTDPDGEQVFISVWGAN